MQLVENTEFSSNQTDIQQTLPVHGLVILKQSKNFGILGPWSVQPSSQMLNFEIFPIVSFFC